MQKLALTECMKLILLLYFSPQFVTEYGFNFCTLINMTKFKLKVIFFKFFFKISFDRMYEINFIVVF